MMEVAWSRPALRRAALRVGLPCLLASLLVAQAASQVQAPRTLRVAITPVPPMMVAARDGPPSGLAVELLEELASNLGYGIEYVRFPTIGAYRTAIVEGEVDLAPILPTQVADHEGVPRSRSYETLNVRAFVRADSPVRSLDEALRGGTVGVGSSLVEGLVLRRNPEADVVVHRTFAHLLFALLSGSVDRAVSMENVLLDRAEDLHLGGEIRALDTALAELPMAISGPVREAAIVAKFDEALGVFVQTNLYDELVTRYLRETTPYWNVSRLIVILEVVGGLMALVTVGGLLLLRRERRQKAKVYAELQSRVDGETRRIREAIDQLETAIFAIDGAGSVVMTNDAADHLVAGVPGLDATAWLRTRKFAPLLHHSEATAPDIQECIRQVRPIRNETVHLDMSGTEAGDIGEPGGRVVRVAGMPRTAATDNVQDYDYLLTLTDVTAEHEARTQLERIYRLEATGQLAGGLAHDFGNILGIIRLSAEVAMRSGQEEVVADRLEAIAKASRRGGDLTDRILAFARQQPATVRTVPLAPFLDDLIGMAHRTIESGYRLTARVDPGLTVLCDPGQLENALLNLILNARDAMKSTSDSGAIEIAARSGGKPGMVAITVTDTGPGMSEAVRQRATEPFFTTKQTHRGSGLGLAMVAAFVAQAGGELALLPGPRRAGEGGARSGTVARLTLPEGDPSEMEEPAERTLRPIGEAVRVLLVEDELELRRVMEIALKAMGCDVLSAGDGLEGLTLLEVEGPMDVLVSDVVLPNGTSGFEFARQALELQPGLPVIYVSGYADEGAETRMRVRGPFLRKPIDTASLARAFEQVLAAPAHGSRSTETGAA